MNAARAYLGLAVVTPNNDVIGLIKDVFIQPRIRAVEGFGVRGSDKISHFLPLEAILDRGERHVVAMRAHVADRLSMGLLDPIGLRAWTTRPKFLAGLVYDCDWQDGGAITGFAVHQLVRKWQIPIGAVTEINDKGIWIDNGTRFQLDLTPFVAPLTGAEG